MKEIIEFIYTYKGKLSFFKLALWCNQNNKIKELQLYQNLIIEMVKEHNNEQKRPF